jgi:hypothetical protein
LQYIHGVQELRSIFWDLIPELMRSQKYLIHMGIVLNGLGVKNFLNTVNTCKLERREERCAFIEICC